MIPGQKNDVFGKNDLSFDGQKQPGIIEQSVNVTSSFISKIFTDFFGIVNPHHYLFLALLGTFTAIVTFFTDLVSIYIIDCKEMFDDLISNREG